MIEYCSHWRLKSRRCGIRWSRWQKPLKPGVVCRRKITNSLSANSLRALFQILQLLISTWIYCTSLHSYCTSAWCRQHNVFKCWVICLHNHSPNNKDSCSEPPSAWPCPDPPGTVICVPCSNRYMSYRWHTACKCYIAVICDIWHLCSKWQLAHIKELTSEWHIHCICGICHSYALFLFVCLFVCLNATEHVGILLCFAVSQEFFITSTRWDGHVTKKPTSVHMSNKQNNNNKINRH